MKHTKKSVVFFTMQIICFLIIPAVFIWLQSGGLAVKYKLSMTAVISLIVVFLMFKKIMLNSWLKKIDGKVAQIEVTQLATVDESAISSLKRKWRTLSVIQLIINAVIPLAILALFLMTIKVVEAGLIRLYGCLLISSFSMALGVVFKIAEIYSVRCEHEK